MNVYRVKVSLLNENAYFVVGKNNDAVIIDPGSDFDDLCEFAEKSDLNLKAVLLTHAHYDHISAASDMSEKFDIPIYIHAQEEKILTDNDANYSAHYGFELKLNEYKLYEEDSFKFGDNELKILFTPGHTPGSVCFYSEDDGFIISGDMVFYGTVGRTDLMYGNDNDMKNSLIELMKLPEATIVFPGHGRETSIGREKLKNPYISRFLR